ncbi:MAG: cyclic nucleotide-binding domain-containing protein [Rhodospirillales bacterium]|nr:cyclic nucleotide-binding domain-containing protein [Thalassospira sp.]MBR9780216.1 cyclic nucleotide-binding domain-containing protein [Rhodospirillales bacterium]MCD1594924.1 cyclic nucleotide-binding domain-containing protein [Thalassospira xiamenensis]QPL37910.1 cyclic nucleotide-binding domain-containing protein [Thalassospira sp. B30-1]MBR9817476.1 cyclic nucleotide-binding domain-containing protein [Rhodospirillales bacterium]
MQGTEHDRLRQMLTHVQFDPHSTIFHEAEDADYVFNVTSGSVKLYKLLGDGRRQITGFLFPGDFLGLALNTTYSYTAEAIEPVTACRFPREKLEKLFDEFPRLEKRMLGMAVDELAAAQDQMLLLGRKTAKEKVASFLLMLARRQEHRGEESDTIQVPMSRSDIADYLGLTIETVSRTLTQLRKEATITLKDNRHIEAVGIDMLEDLAEGL